MSEGLAHHERLDEVASEAPRLRRSPIQRAKRTKSFRTFPQERLALECPLRRGEPHKDILSNR